MDSRLKIILNGNPEEELHLLIRLQKPGETPPHVKVICRFGDVISGRLLRKNLPSVYSHPSVKSIKAPRVIALPNAHQEASETYPPHHAKPLRVHSVQPEAKTVFGIIDFGFDFTHPDFIDNGQSRFEKIWVQSLPDDGNRYGYGKVIDRPTLTAALAKPQPFKEVGYYPNKTDILGLGTHGTHVLGIACGNGRVGRKGLAAACPVVAVDMAASPSNGSNLSLGDSVKLIEALNFIVEQAGRRPLVINMSLGGTGDLHNGQTLVEMAIDNLLKSRKNTAIVQSTGNYFAAKTHSFGQIKEKEKIELPWVFKKNDRTPNEMEIWYEGCDELSVEVLDENGNRIGGSRKFQDSILTHKKDEVGVILHRRNEPNSGKNHIAIFTNGRLQSPFWTVRVIGEKVKDGHFHAYIERDDRGQSFFGKYAVTTTHTTNSICNSRYGIAVGAYNQTTGHREILPFSSSGPTTDGRMKPELVAPGSNIAAACSASKKEAKAAGKLCTKSGSSMAAPYVASVVARILEKKPGTDIHGIRAALFKLCTPLCHEQPEDEFLRYGHGYIHPKKLFHFLNP